ncbi:hypothetical protein [Haloarcula sp. JP-L23]|uniref:hypothetical protein n=1 Tax=Haloarcula sp. JP-L23 TaxID=2716717 RepID=UPI00140EA73E|nr:hypothetical protein G9465_24400 [Haloarcula sp. JP-L23]
MSARTGSVLDAVPTERIERAAPTVERWVAVATVLLYGVGDVATTYVSEQLGGYESNQLVWGLLHEYGSIALVGHKAAAFALIVAGWLAITALARLVDHRPHVYRAAFLSLYAGRGLVLTVSNATVIYQLL